MMISNHIKKRLNEFYFSKYNFNNFVKVQIESEDFDGTEDDEPECDIDLFIYSFTGISPAALELAESIFTEYFTRMGVTFKDTSMFSGTYEKWQLDREKQKEELVFKGNPTDNLNDLIDQWYDFPIKKPSKLRRR